MVVPSEYDFEFEGANSIATNRFEYQTVTFQVASTGNKLLPLPSTFDLLIGNCPVGFGRSGGCFFDFV